MSVVYGNSKHFRVQQVVATAELAGKKVSVKDEQPPVPVTTQIPVYIEGKLTLLGTTAISVHLAKGNATLLGKTDEEKAQVLSWIQLNDTKLTPTFMSWLLPAVSCAPLDKKQFEEAKSHSSSLLKLLNAYLLNQTFFVGERLTIADVALAMSVKPLYENLLEDGCRKELVNLTRWFNTIVNQPAVKKAVGAVSLCSKASAFDGNTYKQYQAKLGAGASTSAAKPKADKPQEAKPDKKKKDKKKNDDDDDDEGPDATAEALAQEAPKKDPFADMPKGNWNMDEFKRVYSNEDTETKALPYFWEHFEKDNYSIWHCEYKFPEDLTQTFMSCNLIAGMFQRLEKLRKNAFGSMCLFGTNNASTISGVWFWKGQGLAFELSPDWMIDYESYKWTKLNPEDPKTKELVKEYFTWEGKFDGKSFNQGKIFK